MEASQGEERRLRAGTARLRILALPLAGCVRPSGLLVFNLSDLRVYICKIRAKTALPSQGCTDETTQRQLSLELCPVLSWPFLAPGKVPEGLLTKVSREEPAGTCNLERRDNASTSNRNTAAGSRLLPPQTTATTWTEPRKPHSQDTGH